MAAIFSWFLTIVILSALAFLVITNAIRFVMLIKCFKIKECNKRRCINKVMCEKYYEALTDDEYYELLNMIKDARRKYEKKCNSEINTHVWYSIILKTAKYHLLFYLNIGNKINSHSQWKDKRYICTVIDSICPFRVLADKIKP